jgi:hypothetical protein
MTQARYCIIPTAALEDPEITDKDLRVLAALGSYLGKDLEAWPSQSTIAERARCTRENVNRAIKKMVEKGYITAHKRGDGGMKRSLKYTVNLDVIPGSQRCDPTITTDVIKLDHNRCDQAGSHPIEDTQLKIPNEDTSKTREVFEFYNETARDAGWVVHSKLTDALRKPLNARINDHGADQVKAFIKAMTQLAWTSKGFDGNRSFKASLTYICRPRTFAEHFDKLVTNAPTKRTADNDDLERLEWLFKELRDGGKWLGHRYGFNYHPTDPLAKYPENLYVRYSISHPERLDV